MNTKETYHRYSKRVTNSKRWQVLRQFVLERDNWSCIKCGENRIRLDIDHIVPVRDKPELSFEPSNLQVLCFKCHSSKTREELGFPSKLKSPELDSWASSVDALMKGHINA